MKTLPEQEIETYLSEIEFPGEDDRKIKEYLEKADIPEAVIRNIQAAYERKHRMKIWGIVAALSLLLLLILGADQYVIGFLFFLQSAITLFLAVALSVVFLTGLIGFIFNIDFSKIEKLFHHNGSIGDFINRLFHS